MVGSNEFVELRSVPTTRGERAPVSASPHNVKPRSSSMTGKVRAWRSKHVFIAVALLGSAYVVSSSRERRLFSGSRWARAPWARRRVHMGRNDNEKTGKNVSTMTVFRFCKAD